MKTALILSILCAAALLNGCCSNRGGTTDAYGAPAGSLHQTEPAVTDPSLPQDPNFGLQMPPP